MPVRAAEHEYEFVEEAAEARQLSLQSGTAGSMKAVVKIALGTFGLTLVALAWAWRGAVGPARTPTGEIEQVAEDFEVKRFPEDCGKFMRYTGCEKKRWTCDSDEDHSDGYRCCCDSHIWDSQTRQSPLKTSSGGVSVLRLEKSMGACLGGPEAGGSHFSLAPCDEERARLALPAKGSGAVRLDGEKGKCLGVTGREGHRHVEVVPCGHGAAEQMFQLTDGDSGMLQWSHGGDLCLDTEDDSTGTGSKIVLGDCVYWPKKDSQVYSLEDAPQLVKKGKEGEEEEAVTHPSLFCTSLMLPWSYEVDMLRSQLARNVGIFQCDAWAVFSNEKVKLKEGATSDEDVYCDIINGSLKAEIGGKFHTALNTPIFQRFWKLLTVDGRAWSYDWTIKVDPDCVFFPHRLKGMLANEYKPAGTPGDAVWLNNCQLGLHGPIEVFTKQALGAYKDSHGVCDSVAEEHGQEDVFLRHCFEKLELPKINVFNLLLESEWACNERPSSSTNMPPCYDRQVAFHPFKSVETYFKCYDKAAKMSWSTPLYFNSVPPSADNAHHS